MRNKVTVESTRWTTATDRMIETSATAATMLPKRANMLRMVRLAWSFQMKVVLVVKGIARRMAPVAAGVEFTNEDPFGVRLRKAKCAR